MTQETNDLPKNTPLPGEGAPPPAITMADEPVTETTEDVISNTTVEDAKLLFAARHDLDGVMTNEGWKTRAECL